MINKLTSDTKFSNPYLLYQKIGYDNAAAVAKKAHKEGSTLKVKQKKNLYYMMCLEQVKLICNKRNK